MAGQLGASGVYVDQDGQWDVYRNYQQHAMELHNRATHQRKMVDMSDWYNQLQAASIYGYGSMLGGMLNAAPKDDRTLKKKLVDSRNQRWYRRVVRMKQKKLERHLGRLLMAAWVLFYLWGAAVVVVITSKLFAWATRSVLG